MVAQCVAHNIGHPEPGVFVLAQCVAHNLPKSQKQEHNIEHLEPGVLVVPQCEEHNFRVVGLLAQSRS